jgi:hypothetical protein
MLKTKGQRVGLRVKGKSFFNLLLSALSPSSSPSDTTAGIRVKGLKAKGQVVE